MELLTKLLRVAASAPLALLCALVASPARAEISIDDSLFSVEGFAGRDQNGDNIILDDEADIDEFEASGVLSFSQTLDVSTPSSEASASHTTNVTALADRLTVVSNADCGSSSDQGDEATQAHGDAAFFLEFSLTAQARLSVTASLEASENGRVSLGAGPIAYEVIDGDQAVADEVTLEPGTHFVSVVCAADTYFDPGFEGFETSTSSWTLQVTVTEGEGEEDCETETLIWVGERAGAFGDPENWDPPQVPLSDEDAGRCDEMVVQGGRGVVIDLAGAAAAGLGPLGAVERNVHGVTIDGSRELRPVNGTLVGDNLSPVVGERSLEIQQGGSLLLETVAVHVRHAAIGALGEGAIDVAGGGRLETTGRLGLGVDGSGSLLVRDGGQAIAAEAVLGESVAQGSATVRGPVSKLETGNIAIGLEDDGALLVDAGGLVTSETGVIDFDLGDEDRGLATVRGKDSAGNPSTWTLDELDVGTAGKLAVEGGGKVVVAGELEIGLEPAGADCLTGKACVQIDDGEVVAGSLTIGSAGGGELKLGPEGGLSVSGVTAIGVADRRGRLTIDGPNASRPALLGDVRVAVANHGLGVIALENGADLTVAALKVGTGVNSFGTVNLSRDEGAAKSVLTTTGAAVVGFASALPQDERPRTGELVLVPGDYLSDSDLVIEGTGALHSDGGRVVLEGTAKLVNRGRILGDLLLQGSYAAEAGGIMEGSFLTPPLASPTQQLRSASPLLLARLTAAPPPPPFAPMVVTGDAALAGTAKLQFGNGVAPEQGDQLTLIQVEGEVTGAFDAVEIAGLAPGFDYGAEILGGALVVTALNDGEPLPSVNLAGKPVLVETKKAAKLKLTRSGDTSAPLSVAYTIGGSAESGVDYVALPGTIQFPARKKSVTLLVQPIADGLAEGSETIEIALAPDASFAPGLASELTLELRDGR